MAQENVFIKEIIKPEGKEFSAYTTLVGLTKSCGLFHIIGVIRYEFNKQDKSSEQDKNLKFQYENIVIRKVKLFHQKHSK